MAKHSPELDQVHDYPDDSLFANTPGLNSETPATEANGAAEHLSVAEIMAQHAERQAQKAARFVQLESSNWLPGRIAEKLDREFPDLVDGATIEAEDKKADATVRHERKSENPASKPPAFRRRGGDGPPPNVAAEYRT